MAPPFLWGAATAGHQVEGNNIASDVWLLEQVPGTTFLAPSGDACDSLHRWREDIAIVLALGLNAYRLSIEWSRVEATKGQFSTAWLNHYAGIVARLRAQDIAPVVTLSHFTSPRWFAAAGGWQQAEAPALFARFVARVARRMGRAVSHAITFNEPNLPLMNQWTATPIADAGRRSLDAMLAAAAAACGSDRFDVWVYSRGTALAHLLAGHRAARLAWKAEAPDTQLGMSLAVPDAQGDATGIAAYRAVAEAPFLAAAREDDFIGVQTNGRLLFADDRTLAPPANAELTQAGDEFYPAALGHALSHVHAASGLPVLVTENGIAAANDEQRARYIPAALSGLDRARADGAPVIGYIHWSLLDNFEWRRGYSQQFGLVAVDRQTFRRTVKPSARVYAEQIRRRA